MLNDSTSLPVHVDANNEGEFWVYGLAGEWDNGRLWIEEAGGTDPPPTKDNGSLRGRFYDVHGRWVTTPCGAKHAVEPLLGPESRRCLVLFNPKAWKGIPDTMIVDSTLCPSVFPKMSLPLQRKMWLHCGTMVLRGRFGLGPGGISGESMQYSSIGVW
eukprot:3873805-Amphidinium_carterae.2